MLSRTKGPQHIVRTAPRFRDSIISNTSSHSVVGELIRCRSSRSRFSRPLPPPIIGEIIQLQNKYGVLAFRSTRLNDETHVRYSKNFGALESIHGLNKPRRASSLHLYDAGNLDPEGNIIPKGSRAWWHSKGNGLWHTDSSFNQHRSSYSALRAVELPS
jgi:alpha-ketoglutarate-dependent 2,4-dichlorophenoxyacetate dioxygenase